MMDSSAKLAEHNSNMTSAEIGGWGQESAGGSWDDSSASGIWGADGGVDPSNGGSNLQKQDGTADWKNGTNYEWKTDSASDSIWGSTKTDLYSAGGFGSITKDHWGSLIGGSAVTGSDWSKLDGNDLGGEEIKSFDSLQRPTVDPIGPGHRRSSSVADSTCSSDGKNESSGVLSENAPPFVSHQLSTEKHDERSQPDGAEVQQQNKEDLITKMVNSNEGWGQRPVRQDVPWQISESLELPTPPEPPKPAAAAPSDGMYWNQPPKDTGMYWNAGASQNEFGGTWGVPDTPTSTTSSVGSWGSNPSDLQRILSNPGGLGYNPLSETLLKDASLGGLSGVSGPIRFPPPTTPLPGDLGAAMLGRDKGTGDPFGKMDHWDAPATLSSDAMIGVWGQHPQQSMAGGDAMSGQLQPGQLQLLQQLLELGVRKEDAIRHLQRQNTDKLAGFCFSSRDNIGDKEGQAQLNPFNPRIWRNTIKTFRTFKIMRSQAGGMGSEQHKGRMLRGKTETASVPDAAALLNNFNLQGAGGLPNLLAANRGGMMPGVQPTRFPSGFPPVARQQSGFDPNIGMNQAILQLQGELQPLLQLRSQIQQNVTMSTAQKSIQLEQLNVRIAEVKQRIGKLQLPPNMGADAAFGGQAGLGGFGAGRGGLGPQMPGGLSGGMPAGLPPNAGNLQDIMKKMAELNMSTGQAGTSQAEQLALLQLLAKLKATQEGQDLLSMPPNQQAGLNLGGHGANPLGNDAALSLLLASRSLNMPSSSGMPSWNNPSSGTSAFGLPSPADSQPSSAGLGIGGSDVWGLPPSMSGAGSNAAKFSWPQHQQQSSGLRQPPGLPPGLGGDASASLWGAGGGGQGASSSLWGHDSNAWGGSDGTA